MNKLGLNSLCDLGNKDIPLSIKFNMFKDKFVRGQPVEGILAVFGAFLIMLNLGAFYTFGNISPYMVSYMRNSTGEDITYSQFTNVNLAYGISNAIVIFLAPLVFVHFIGYRGIAILGAVCTVAGCLATRWALDMNINMVILTYGLIQGMGAMSFIPCYLVPMMWFPKHRGVVMGIVLGGYGISSTMWSQIQLAITNPNNVEAVGPEDGDKYFEDPDVLDRVPTLLYVMAVFYAVFLTVGIICMGEPDSKEETAGKSEKKLSEINYGKAASNFTRHVLSKREFYLMATIRFGFTMVTFTIPNYYKALGLFLDCEIVMLQLVIDRKRNFLFRPKKNIRQENDAEYSADNEYSAQENDDAFLTNYIGTLSGISQLLSRVIYGTLLDILPFHLLVGFQSILLGVSISLLYTMANVGEVSFVLWMHLIYLTFPGIYAIVPAKCRDAFGPKYGGIVIGSLSLLDIPLNLTIGIVSEAILGDSSVDPNYLTFFLFVASGSVIALLSVLLFPFSKEDKRRFRVVWAVLTFQERPLISDEEAAAVEGKIL